MFITFTVNSFKFMDANFPGFEEKNLWIFCYCQYIYMGTGLHKPQLNLSVNLNLIDT